MKKLLKIVNIDGVRGIGVTTQTNMLRLSLQKMGLSVKSLKMEKTVDSISKCLSEIESIINENSNDVVVIEGSMARAISIDILSGMSQSLISDKYREIINKYEVLNHKYGIANILLISDDLKMCEDRIKKRKRLLNQQDMSDVDFNLEKDIVKHMNLLDNTTIIKSIKFHIINIEKDDYMLNVQDAIITYLDNNFQTKKLKI